MEKTKILLISISANIQNGNPYVLIEKPEWEAETIYYTYFDEDGKQIGRRKSINLIASPSNPNPVIPESLKDDILNPEVIKLFWTRNTRIFASAILGYPKHNYIPPDNWIDIKAFLRENGYPTDSLSDVATKLKLYDKKKCKYNVNQKTESEANRFSVLISIVQRLFHTEVVRTKSMTSYEITERVNDNGVLINTKVLDAALYMIKLYEQATFDYMKNKGILNSSNKEQMKTEVTKDLKQDLLDKFNLDKVDDVYQLLCRPEELSEKEINLIYILKFFLSRTYTFFSRFRSNLCSDNRLRGAIKYWADTVTGTYGGTKLFDCESRTPIIKPEDIIESISYIEDVDITDCELILNTLKTLRSLLIQHQHPYVIVDLSRVTEKVVAKISNCHWRLQSYKEDNLEDVLMERWTNFPFSSKRIVEYDLYVAKYGYNVFLSSQALSEWKEINVELSNGKAMLLSAFLEARKGKGHAVAGIEFNVHNDSLIIMLPTGRVITLPFREDKNDRLRKIVGVLDDKPLHGDYLFKTICDLLQREVLTCILAKLVSYGCKVNYFTNNQICIDNMEYLPAFLNAHDYIKGV